jgi:hypothetical protein
MRKSRPFGVKAMQANQNNRTTLSVSPLAAQALEAFYRDLPELLKKHPGR